MKSFTTFVLLMDGSGAGGGHRLEVPDLYNRSDQQTLLQREPADLIHPVQASIQSIATQLLALVFVQMLATRMLTGL